MKPLLIAAGHFGVGLGRAPEFGAVVYSYWMMDEEIRKVDIRYGRR
jgi:hypothetical protein